MRPLRLCEEKGIWIRHKTADSKAQIVGDYVGGFVVQMCLSTDQYMLPFEQIKDWNVFDPNSNE